MLLLTGPTQRPLSPVGQGYSRSVMGDHCFSCVIQVSFGVGEAGARVSVLVGRGFTVWLGS